MEPFVDPVTRRKVVLLPCDERAAADILARDIGVEVRALPLALAPLHRRAQRRR